MQACAIGGVPQTNEHVPIYHKLIHKKSNSTCEEKMGRRQWMK